MAVIGAHDMTYLGRATDIHFITKINGTHELTFQMPDRYFDSELGDYVLNEFKDYVLNENKVKLSYKGEWYEFYVKTIKDTKHYKSYMKNYTCTDAFIDELARNGYGITFDTELYNNVEEIGIFSDEILEGSLWTYSPENNWGDFTEFIEEKLFKIPVNQMRGLSGYKVNFAINSNQNIINRFTKEKRTLELGDDLARVQGYFWDGQEHSIPLLENKIDIPNDGYIYVPYSQLDFCYKTTSEGNGNYIVATEEPVSATINGITSYLLAPPTIDPSALIQFIAIPEGAEVEIDEAGLIVNKNYTYVMTVKDWNNNVNTNYWYTQDLEADAGKDYKKEVVQDEPQQYWFYNKCVVYDGYLNKINDLDVECGKKISISDRTEVNISKEIDQYVKVYKNKYIEYNDLYTNPEGWQEKSIDYRVCSKLETRQIVPQLARNYFENAVNIQTTNGWEVQAQPDSINITPAKIELKWYEDSPEPHITKKWANLAFTKSDASDLRCNTIINFGAVGQEKVIETNKVYCFGIVMEPDKTSAGSFEIGKGSIDNYGNYTIANAWSKGLLNQEEQFYFITFEKEIENPYLALRFDNDVEIKEVWFFEAYTKGRDQFPNGTFKYSGRDYILNQDEKSTIYLKAKMSQKVIFETDIMRGDTYGYQRYFIQQLKTKEENPQVYDTFMAKRYISEDANDGAAALPLPASKYTDDDYEIITNYIDLNKCEYYQGNTEVGACDCNYGNTCDKICMYQKYGYCPYRFTTEKHCRKVRTLTGSKSNRFNLTQELGRVFEVYPIYYIEHNSNGSIKLDENGTPIKNVFYITEKGKENKLGFRYEKNLSNISRNIVSDKIVSKLYVLDVDSELSKTGLCSIKTAEDNISKDNFIIDLSYYVKIGALDKDQVERDLYGIDGSLEDLGFLKQLGYYNNEYDKLSNKIINLTNQSFGELQSNVNVDITGIESVLKEIAKLNKQMAQYYKQDEAEDKQNDTYKNYQEKLKQQNARLASLQNELTNSNDYTPDELREDFEEKHRIEDGMLGQYNAEYKAIQEWKKQRAAYLKKINELSDNFYKRYEPYLKEGTWSDSNYITDNAYYHDALSVAAEGAIPKVSYNIKVVPLGILDEDYEIDIADTSYVEDIGMFGINKKTGLPNRLKVIISQLDENLDEPSENSISIQNFTTQFEDLFQQVTASVQSLTYNENIYKRSSNFTSNQNVKTESLQGTLDGNNLILLNTEESNIKLDAQGQAGSDINNHNNKYKLNGQGLFFSNNGGERWNVGVGPDGINADYINTGTLDAGRIRIVDNNYVYFLWDKGGITAYREPQQDREIKNDFARFNKQGLSLVENNKIRLRAGYAFSGNDGEINTEDTTTGNIGFYLYDNKGRVIFSTETVSNDRDESARLTLTGEINTKSKAVDLKIKTYTYTSEYIFTENMVNYYTIDIGHSYTTIDDPQVISLKIKDASTSELLDTNCYKDSDDNYYYYDDGNSTPLYYALKSFEANVLQEISEESFVNKNEDIEANLLNYIEERDGKQYVNTSFTYYVNNTYYKTKTPIYEPDPLSNNEIAGYINNMAIGEENSDDLYSKRLITYARTTGANNSNLANIFSVLADGTLYIGGQIQPRDQNRNTLSNLDDYIKITPSGTSMQLTSKGEIIIGNTDIKNYVESRINDEIAQTLNKLLIAHNHLIKRDRINLDFNVPSQITTRKTKFTRNIDGSLDALISTSDHISSMDLANSWIAISPKEPNAGYPDKMESTITWIKLEDFFKYINIEGATEITGEDIGGGDVPHGDTPVPTPTTIQEWVLRATSDLVNAHFLHNPHYDHTYAHVDPLITTLNGHAINSRRDCSGLVDGIFQYLGDAPSTYICNTMMMRSNMPKNWIAIPTSSINYDKSQLQPGDVLLNPSAHTEIVVSVNGNNVRCKGFGSDEKLYASQKSGGYNLQYDLRYFFTWVLRKVAM